MGFLTTRFPDLIASGATGGHGYWQTTIPQTVGGYETPNLDSADARGRWNISHGLKVALPDGSIVEDRRRHEVARDFYYMARGKFHRFRFKDYTDFFCHRNHGKLVLISGNTYQASRVYGNEVAFQYVRRLTRLVENTVSVWVNGVLQSIPGDVAVDINTGRCVFASSPGAATLEFSAHFDVPCRFDSEQYDARLVYRSGAGANFIEWQDINIVEVLEGEV
jgi:uncharacterized protein (TIGR02217 family)